MRTNIYIVEIRWYDESLSDAVAAATPEEACATFKEANKGDHLFRYSKPYATLRFENVELNPDHLDRITERKTI